MIDVDRSGWRKSSFSKSGNCIEVAEDWRKSSASVSDGHCIEVTSGVKVRDTAQHEAGPILRFSPAAWRRFTDRLKTESDRQCWQRS